MFDRPGDQFRARIAEHRFRLRVRQRDQALVVDHENRARHRLDDRPEALLAGAQLGRQLRCRDHVPAEFVAHRENDDEDARHDDRRRMDQPERDQGRETRDGGNADHQAATDDDCAATRIGTASAPERDGGIDDERPAGAGCRSAARSPTDWRRRPAPKRQRRPRTSPGPSRRLREKLMFTPVTKFRASPASRKPEAAQASQSLPAPKWKCTNQTIDSTNKASGTWAHRRMVA